MHPMWKQESELAQSLEHQRALGHTSSPLMAGHHFQDEDLANLDQTVLALQDVQRRVVHNKDHYRRVRELIEFVQHFRKVLLALTPSQAFERIQPLRRWLFWLPPAMLQGGSSDVSALAIIAQFYGVGVVLDSIFPDMGGAYLGPLAVDPIEEIYRVIVARNSADPFNPNAQLDLSLMDLPRHIARKYTTRHWSPRPSVDHYPPSPPSPYSVQDYRVASASPSSASASATYASYTPPQHSPAAVSMGSSPFDVAATCITAPASTAQAFYPPSPLSNAREEVSSFSAASATTAYPAAAVYVEDMLCTLPRPDGAQMGMGQGLYSEAANGVPVGGLATEAVWT